MKACFLRMPTSAINFKKQVLQMKIVSRHHEWFWHVCPRVKACFWSWRAAPHQKKSLYCSHTKILLATPLICPWKNDYERTTTTVEKANGLWLHIGPFCCMRETEAPRKRPPWSLHSTYQTLWNDTKPWALTNLSHQNNNQYPQTAWLPCSENWFFVASKR